jgi:hypothetical protein
MIGDGRDLAIRMCLKLAPAIAKQVERDLENERLRILDLALARCREHPGEGVLGQILGDGAIAHAPHEEAHQRRPQLFQLTADACTGLATLLAIHCLLPSRARIVPARLKSKMGQ